MALDTVHSTLVTPWPKHPDLTIQYEVGDGDVTFATLTYDVIDEETDAGRPFKAGEVTGAKMGPYWIDRQMLLDICGHAEIADAEQYITDELRGA